MTVGVIKSIGRSGEFGFIAAKGESGDVWFHRSQLISDEPFTVELQGRAVDFELQADHRGRPRAVGVRLVSCY